MTSEVLFNYSWAYWSFVFKCDNHGYHSCSSALNSVSIVYTLFSLCWYHSWINQRYSVESCCNGLNCLPLMSISSLCQRLSCSKNQQERVFTCSKTLSHSIGQTYGYEWLKKFDFLLEVDLFSDFYLLLPSLFRRR